MKGHADWFVAKSESAKISDFVILFENSPREIVEARNLHLYTRSDLTRDARIGFKYKQIRFKISLPRPADAVMHFPWNIVKIFKTYAQRNRDYGLHCGHVLQMKIYLRHNDYKVARKHYGELWLHKPSRASFNGTP